MSKSCVYISQVFWDNAYGNDSGSTCLDYLGQHDTNIVLPKVTKANRVYALVGRMTDQISEFSQKTSPMLIRNILLTK
jgi:hypothetical protein